MLNIAKKKLLLQLITMTTEMDFRITQDLKKQNQIFDDNSQWPSANSYWTLLRELETLCQALCGKPHNFQ